jgi:hypothetical protein
VQRMFRPNRTRTGLASRGQTLEHLRENHESVSYRAWGNLPKQARHRFILRRPG